MSIGETLARSREEAGLTVPQISRRTRIRESMIRAIERDEFSMCGGNFYARGHIRNIAQAIGIDPEPLVREYDETHGGAPQIIRATEVFRSETPIKLAERRSPNWSAAMAVALALIVVFGVVRVLGGQPEAKTPEINSQAIAQPQGTAAAPQRVPLRGDPSAADKGTVAGSDRVVVRISATKTTWLSVRNSRGKEIFEGLLYRGDSREWKDRRLLYLVVGNAGGVTVTVNGTNIGAPGSEGDVKRLQFRPGDPAEA